MGNHWALCIIFSFIFAFFQISRNDEVYAFAKQGYDIMQISQMLSVQANLMLIKM